MTQVDLVLVEAALASLASSTHLEVQASDWGVRASGLRSPYRSHIHYKFLPGHGGPERLLLRNYRYVLVVAEHPPKEIAPRHLPIEVDSSIYEEEWRGGKFPGSLVRSWVLSILRRLQLPQVRWDLDGESIGLWVPHPTVGAFNGGVPCPCLTPGVGRKVEEAWDGAPDTPTLRLRIGGVEARPLTRDLPLPTLGNGAEVWGVSIGPDHGDRYRASVAIFGGYGWAVVRGPAAIRTPEGRLEIPEDIWILRIPLPRRRA